MLRCLQGLLLLGVALFALKWEFHGSRDKPFITPNGEVRFLDKSFFLASPPWNENIIVEAGVLAVVGFYLWLTGEVARWRGQVWRYSPVTFLAVTAAFLAVFTAKFSYHHGDPSGYYPPFDKGSLGFAWLFFSVLAVYYLVIGEVQFWRRKAMPANTALPPVAALRGPSPREGFSGGRGG
jgi:hypothetical protein